MQVGNISPYNLEKNFNSFYYQISGRRWDYVTRVIHNQEQVIRCQLRDGTNSPKGFIKYWNMDGTEAAQFTIGSGGIPYTNIHDVCWLTDEERLCYVMPYSGGVGLGSEGYSVVSALPDGASPEVLVRNINTTNTVNWPGPTTSGYVNITSNDDFIYLKIGPELHEIDRSAFGISYPWDWTDLVSGSYVRSATDCFHYGNGDNCRNLMFQEQDSGAGHILYSWFDSTISVLYLRSITASGAELEYVPDRWTMLGITDYGNIQYPLFLNQLDPDALHYMAVTTTTGVSGYTVTVTPSYFEVFNIDDELAAFLNVNSSDAVMPAGIGATATIQARVANCWGTTLSGKLVQFWVSSGDGGVFPTYTYTDEDGRAETEFTTGANVGISNVAVVVNEI
jgi:hypothetical protein